VGLFRVSKVFRRVLQARREARARPGGAHLQTTRVACQFPLATRLAWAWIERSLFPAAAEARGVAFRGMGIPARADRATCLRTAGDPLRQRSIVVACDFSVKLCATRFPLPTQRFTANPALGRPLLKQPERPPRAPVFLRDKAISEGIEGLTASAPPAHGWPLPQGPARRQRATRIPLAN
jgi:hypothetical protein